MNGEKVTRYLARPIDKSSYVDPGIEITNATIGFENTAFEYRQVSTGEPAARVGPGVEQAALRELMVAGKFNGDSVTCLDGECDGRAIIALGDDGLTHFNLSKISHEIEIFDGSSVLGQEFSVERGVDLGQ